MDVGLLGLTLCNFCVDGCTNGQYLEEGREPRRKIQGLRNFSIWEKIIGKIIGKMREKIWRVFLPWAMATNGAHFVRRNVKRPPPPPSAFLVGCVIWVLGRWPGGPLEWLSSIVFSVYYSFSLWEERSGFIRRDVFFFLLQIRNCASLISHAAFNCHRSRFYASVRYAPRIGGKKRVAETVMSRGVRSL